MKTVSKFLLSVVILILATCPGAAQEQQALSSDLLRTKVEQFEKTDITSKSDTVRSIYQRTLLRLYNQFNSALKQDIADLRTMQSAVSGTNTESQNEIALQLQKLLREQSEVAEKIQTLTGDVRSTAAVESPAAAEPTATVAAPTRARTANTSATSQHPVAFSPARDNGKSASYAISDVPVSTSIQPVNNTIAAAAPQVTGRVTVTNEQFFKNAHKFTPDQLRRAVQKEAALRAAKLKKDQKQIDIATTIDAPNIRVERKDKTGKQHGNADNQTLEVILKGDHVNRIDEPLAEVSVKVENPSDNTFPKEFKTDYQGNYSTTPLADGNYTFSVKVGDFKTSITVVVVGGVATPSPANLHLLVRPLGEFSRAIVGLEQAGASSAQDAQNYFFDLTLSHPLPFQKSVDPYFGPRGRMWGTIRVTSMPQQITSTVGQAATGFAQQVSDIKVNEVARAVEFLAGVDVRITNRPLPFGSFGGQTATKLTLSFIAGGGATTPFNPRQTLEIFRAFPGAPGLPPLPDGTEFVAFVSPDRDRFFRQFYAGFRLQTHYFDYRNPGVPINRYPATLDITYGQNEAVTGGRLRGGVIRLEGFYPLPYEELKFINLFGTALIRPVRTKIDDPLILQPAPSDTIVPATNVFLITVPQINRDYYRVGVGIDFISFVKKLGAGQSK